MTTVIVSIKINTDDLQVWTNEHIANLWHVAQANPAEYGNREACDLVERLSREIVRRWLKSQTPSLWNHQGRHAEAVRSEKTGSAA